MEASKSQEFRQLIANAFRDAVAGAISDVSTVEWEVHRAEEVFSEKTDLSRATGFRFSFDGASAGDVIVAIDYDLLPRLAFRDLQENTAAVAKVQKERLLTALQSRRAELEKSLSNAPGLTIQVELLDGPVLEDHQVVELQCSCTSEGDNSTLLVFLCISATLIADLQNVIATPFVFPHTSTSAGANLDLVMDVELNVTLRFGQRQLALREVLELASGSVVELDRQVDEPVELILDGKVVARGEAVIIDGNYGMRVTQVLQPMIA